MMQCLKYIIKVVVLLLILSPLYAKTTEIVFWHSFAGDLEEKLSKLVTDFNRSQSNYVIKPVYKGEYNNALTSFAAAFQAKQAPALMQVFEVGTTSMLVPTGIIKPAETLLREQRIALPKQDFFPAVRDFYSVNGELQALPLNTSVPVLFYNADLLKQLGYDETNFPTSWDSLGQLAEKLQKKGGACVYTTAFPSWIHVESFSALHNLFLLDGRTQQVNYSHPAIIKHLSRLKLWQKKHYFEYGGRNNDASALFTSGHCALFSQSSGSYKGLVKMVNFRLGVAPLPLDQAISRHRYPNVVGGAALWAIRGHKPAVYAGIGAFYAYLMQPKIQQYWYEQTGYIPLGVAGIYQAIKKIDNQGILLIAEHDLSSDPKFDIARSQRGPLNLLRIINDEAMEAIFAGIKTPKQAMNEAALRTNYVLMRFHQNTAWA